MVCYYVWDWDGGGGGTAHRRLETVKDGTQACAQEGGKEREGGRAGLGKSEGGGGRKRREAVEKLWNVSCETIFSQ